MPSMKERLARYEMQRKLEPYFLKKNRRSNAGYESYHSREAREEMQLVHILNRLKTVLEIRGIHTNDLTSLFYLDRWPHDSLVSYDKYIIDLRYNCAYNKILYTQLIGVSRETIVKLELIPESLMYDYLLDFPEEYENYNSQNLPSLLDTAFTLLQKHVRRYSPFKFSKLTARLKCLSILSILALQNNIPVDALINTLHIDFKLIDGTLYRLIASETFSGTLISKQDIEQYWYLRGIQQGVIKHGFKYLKYLQETLCADERRMARSRKNTKEINFLRLNDDGARHQVVFHKDTKRFSFNKLECWKWKSHPDSVGEKETALYGDSGTIGEIPFEFLRAACNNDTSKLIDLAILFAYCFSCEKLFKGIVAIDSLDIFILFLEMINYFANNSEDTNYYIEDLMQNSTIDNLIQNKIDGTYITMITVKSGKKPTAPQLRRLKKLAAGATIECSDPIIGRKRHKNITQILLFCNEKTMLKISESVPTWLPSFSVDVENLNAAMSELTENHARWLQTVFPMWGLMCKYTRSKKARSAPDETPLQSIQRFITEQCQVGEGFEVEARVLYDAYAGMLSGTNKTTILFKDFNKQIEQSYGFKRCRPHHSRKNNPTVFMGIKLKESIQTPKLLNQTESDRFMQIVSGINKQVMLHCDGFLWE